MLLCIHIWYADRYVQMNTHACMRHDVINPYSIICTLIMRTNDCMYILVLFCGHHACFIVTFYFVPTACILKYLNWIQIPSLMFGAVLVSIIWELRPTDMLFRYFSCTSFYSHVPGGMPGWKPSPLVDRMVLILSNTKGRTGISAHAWTGVDIHAWLCVSAYGCIVAMGLR